MGLVNDGGSIFGPGVGPDVPVKNLRQTVKFKAAPQDVYDALADPKQHARFTGAPAKMERRPGGKFAYWAGDLSGIVLELIPPKRIVLAWRSSGWEEGSYSIASFQIEKAGTGTKLTFEQFGIPAADYEDIADGWKQYYWVPLKAYLDE